MKKIIAILVALVLAIGCVFCFAACSNDGDQKDDVSGESTSNGAESTSGDSTDASDVKIGVILVGDENEGYTYAHIAGIEAAMAELNIPKENVIFKYTVPEDEKCYDTAVDLAEQGCVAIFSNSYGHQAHMQRAASVYPDITFVAATGDTAKASGLKNFCNAFTSIYEARYVSGIVAGLKVAELVENGKLTDKNYDKDGNVKIGYVGAYPYAEVVSGYTAFFLGIQSVYEKVAMDVSYTNSWFSLTDEAAAADALAASGCVIIGQHADSTGAPSAVQALHSKGQEVYSVGYNIDMLSVAPDAALTSATNNWGAYYTYAFGQLLNGEEIATNWSEGYKTDAVAITTLGSACAEGTQAKVDDAVKAIKNGELHVFDTEKFTVGGEKVTSAFATDTDGDFTPDADEAIIDGYYHESYFQSAPSFALRIDGITELSD